MQMTEEQWNKFQSNFLQEDRFSYNDYLKSIGATTPTTTPTTTSTTTPTPATLTGVSARAYEADLTPEERAAAAAVAAAAKADEADALAAETDAAEVVGGVKTRTEADAAADAAAAEVALIRAAADKAIADAKAGATALAATFAAAAAKTATAATQAAADKAAAEAKTKAEADKAAAVIAATKAAEAKAASDAAELALKVAAQDKADADLILKNLADLKIQADAAAAAQAEIDRINNLGEVTQQSLAQLQAANAALKAAQEAADKITADRVITDAAIKAKKDAGPGKGKEAWVWDYETSEFIKPKAPGDEALYDWNDSTGYTPKVKTVETPPPRPANVPKAYIYDSKTKTWIKPPQESPTSTWDDNNGWVESTNPDPLTPPPNTPKGYVYDPATKLWVQPKAPNKTDTWDDVNGVWVPQKGGDKKGLQQVGDLWYIDGALVDGTYNGITYVKGKVTTPSPGDSAAQIAAKTAAAAAEAATKAAADAAAKAEADAKAAADKVIADKVLADKAVADYKTTTRKNMIDVLYARFKNYGLETLAGKIEKLAIDGATEDTITLQLQESEEYKTRFKANDVRLKNNLKYLSPGEYLNLEDSYRQVLRAYGLKTFDNDAYVSQFISNDMSPTELSNRVVTAVQRVRNADPAVSKQLRDYYGIGQEDLVAYVLDPEQQFQKIERQVAASEIGVAAGRQGLTAGVAVAEQLAAQGISQAEAQKGYSTIADILPGAEKLSNIYGATQDTYGQSEGEQEVFNSLASAQRKRQKLSASEQATFSASSGMNRASLTAAKTPGQI